MHENFFLLTALSGSFITQYWVEELFSVIIAIMAFFMKCMWKQIKKEKAEKESLILCMRALLRDRLYQSCMFYVSRKWVTPEDLENLKFLYDNYHNLGGNGTGSILYERVLALEIKTEAPATEECLKPAQSI